MAKDAVAAISPALASVLRSGRDDFNARFLAARRLYPRLNGEAFRQFLEIAVDPLAQAAARVDGNRAAEVIMAAYDAGLELVGQELAGGTARVPLIEEAWRLVLPSMAPLVASDPVRLVAAVSNAVHQLAATPGARPSQWIETMTSLGPECGSVETFLKLGQVVAWRSGLAHFRSGAIAAADTLPEALALGAVGSSAKTGWAVERENLQRSPWHDPAKPGQSPATPRVVAEAGAFRGFGGLFVEPPEVASCDDGFLARSGSDYWLLTADLFGATFHRAAAAEFDAARQKPSTGVTVRGARVEWNGQRVELPALGEITSAAANDFTLGVTGKFTHAIILVARR